MTHTKARAYIMELKKKRLFGDAEKLLYFELSADGGDDSVSGRLTDVDIKFLRFGDELRRERDVDTRCRHNPWPSTK